MTALHGFPPQRAQELLGDDVYPTPEAWRAAMADLCARIRAQIFPLLVPSQQAAMNDYFESVFENRQMFAFTPVLIHQDLYPHNILVDVATETVTGILDWSTCTIGDPAEDVWIPLEYYGGVIDAGWHERRAFAGRLGPCPDLLYVLEHGMHDRVAGLLREVDAMWPPS